MQALTEELRVRNENASFALVGPHGSGKSFTVNNLRQTLLRTLEQTNTKQTKASENLQGKAGETPDDAESTSANHSNDNPLQSKTQLIFPVIINLWLTDPSAMRVHILDCLFEAVEESLHLLERAALLDKKKFISIRETRPKGSLATTTSTETETKGNPSLLKLIALLSLGTTLPYFWSRLEEYILKRLSDEWLLTFLPTTAVSILSNEQQANWVFLFLLLSLSFPLLLPAKQFWQWITTFTPSSKTTSVRSLVGKDLGSWTFETKTVIHSQLTSDHAFVTTLSQILDCFHDCNILLIIEDFDRLSEKLQESHWNIIESLKLINSQEPNNARITTFTTLTPASETVSNPTTDPSLDAINPSFKTVSSTSKAIERVFETFIFLPNLTEIDHKEYLAHRLKLVYPSNLLQTETLLDITELIIGKQNITPRFIDRTVDSGYLLYRTFKEAYSFEACYTATLLRFLQITKIESWRDYAAKLTADFDLKDLDTDLDCIFFGATPIGRQQITASPLNQELPNYTTTELVERTSEIFAFLEDNNPESNEVFGKLLEAAGLPTFYENLGADQKLRFASLIVRRVSVVFSPKKMYAAISIMEQNPDQQSQFTRRSIEYFDSSVLKVSFDSFDHESFQALRAFLILQSKWNLKTEISLVPELFLIILFEEPTFRKTLIATSLSDVTTVSGPVSPQVILDTYEHWRATFSTDEGSFVYFMAQFFFGLHRFNYPRDTSFDRFLYFFFRTGITELSRLFGASDVLPKLSTHTEEAFENQSSPAEFDYLRRYIESVRDEEAAQGPEDFWANSIRLQLATGSLGALVEVARTPNNLNMLMELKGVKTDGAFFLHLAFAARSSSSVYFLDIAFYLLLTDSDPSLHGELGELLDFLLQETETFDVVSKIVRTSGPDFAGSLALGLSKLNLSQANAAKLREECFSLSLTAVAFTQGRIFDQGYQMVDEALVPFVVRYVAQLSENKQSVLFNEEFTRVISLVVERLSPTNSGHSSALRNSILAALESETVETWKNFWNMTPLGARSYDMDRILEFVDPTFDGNHPAWYGMQSCVSALDQPSYFANSLRQMLRFFAPAAQAELLQEFPKHYEPPSSE